MTKNSYSAGGAHAGVVPIVVCRGCGGRLERCSDPRAPGWLHVRVPPICWNPEPVPDGCLYVRDELPGRWPEPVREARADQMFMVRFLLVMAFSAAAVWFLFRLFGVGQ